MKRLTRREFVGGMIALLGIQTGCSFDSGAVSYRGYGALETVSGSLHVISIGSKDIVIDAGVFYDDDEGENYPLPNSLNIDRIEAVFITHAHADHIGRLPLLIEAGYKGPVYMTPITRDITRISTLHNLEYTDFGIEEFYYSRNNKSKSWKPVYLSKYNSGIYHVEEENRVPVRCRRSELREYEFYISDSTIEQQLDALVGKIVEVDYEEVIALGKGISAQFFPTSHLPGSAMVLLTVDNRNILFSGDIGSDNSPFLHKNAEFTLPIDYLFVEGTYGISIRHHDSAAQRLELIEVISSALSSGMRVIIPAFAVDRSQQVLFEIRNGIANGSIPSETEVKLLSPTAEDITKLYKKYSDNREQFQDYFAESMFQGIFDIPRLIINPKSEGVEGDYDLHMAPGSITVMTSGMISTGFSKETLGDYCDDPKSLFISVSYQDKGELGGRLFSGEKTLEIDGEHYEIEAEIFISNAFSGHADIEQIQRVFQNISPERIMLVHLNKDDMHSLHDSYAENYPFAEIVIPEQGETYILFERD